MAVEMDPEEAEESAGAAEAPKPKKAKSKLLILIIIGVLLLALLGVGGFLVYKFVLADKGEEEAPASTEQKQEKDPTKLGLVTALDPFIVNLTGESGKRYLKVAIQVELSSEKVNEELANKMPQIKDSIITVLSSKVTSDLLTVEGKFKLKEEVLTRVNKVLTTGVVKNVYFVEFVIQ